jgi:hypothetical protein
MNETLSRKENGAVGGGPVDLILPVRVRTCAEGVGRTGECRTALAGMSQHVPAMGVTERPVNVTSQGSVSAGLKMRVSTLWTKREIEPLLDPLEGGHAVMFSSTSGAWRGHARTMAIHSDQMKSHVVSTRTPSRASVLYKATPKRHVTRRICEAVSGSADSWDGSRAVVVPRRLEGNETQNRFK